MTKQQIKVGEQVNFMFQGKWSVNQHGHETLNMGTVTVVRGDSAEVKSPNGARFYLNRDMVR